MVTLCQDVADMEILLEMLQQTTLEACEGT